MSDPFDVFFGLELRDADEAPILGAFSGYDLMLGHLVAEQRRRERFAAVLRALGGCSCAQCRADVADMMAGRRVVTRRRAKLIVGRQVDPI